MKILFINPSLRRGAATKLVPVGLGYVMTFVRDHGFEFDLLDIDINDYSDEYIEEYLASHEYDVVLSSCIVTNYKWMKWMTKVVKKYHPATKIIIGNSVAGSAPEVFLRNSAADYSVIGEGEFTTVELLKAIRAGAPAGKVEGIAYLDENDKFVRTPPRKACNVDEFPIVDWDLVDVKKYIEKSDHAYAEGVVFGSEDAPVVMPVSTARGCAFKCTFCHYVFWDDPYRHRSPATILKEIKRNIDKYGATYINFWDDLSFASLKQAEELADAILESGIKFDWDAAIRADLFGHPRFPYERRLEVARKFKESGYKHVSFSLESGNQTIMDMMNKKIQVEYFTEQTRLLQEVGITVTTSVVFGYPIETPESIRQTFDQCLEVQVYPSIGYLLPLPYTGIYDYAKEHGFIVDEDAYLNAITERQDFCLNMTTMSDEQLMREIKQGAMKLNQMLGLGLTPNRLVKTGGYRKHTKLTADCKTRPLLDPENLKRNENGFSFNYSQALFAENMRTQIVTQSQIEARKKKGIALEDPPK